MDAGFLDMFHDAGDKDFPAIAKRVHIHLYRIFQKAIYQNRVTARNHYRIAHIAFQIAHLMNHFHGAATQHIRRANNHWQANFLGNGSGFFYRMGNPVFRLF